MTEQSPRHSAVAWCWKLWPLALLLAAWSVWEGRNVGDALLPVTVTGLARDWVLALFLTGKPL